MFKGQLLEWYWLLFYLGIHDKKKSRGKRRTRAQTLNETSWSNMDENLSFDTQSKLELFLRPRFRIFKSKF